MSTTPSIRRILITWARPVADQLTEVGESNSYYTDLKAGADVVVHRDSLSHFNHPLLPDLTPSEWWLLSGNNTLTQTDQP